MRKVVLAPWGFLAALLSSGVSGCGTPAMSSPDSGAPERPDATTDLDAAPDAPPPDAATLDAPPPDVASPDSSDGQADAVPVDGPLPQDVVAPFDAADAASRSDASADAGSADTGPAVAMLTGRVFDVRTQRPIAGARVVSVSGLATTGTDGCYAIPVPSDVRTVLNIDAPGYGDGAAAVQLDRGLTGYRELFLAGVSASTTFDAASGTALKVGSELGVELDAGAIQRVGGATVTGNVRLEVTLLHPRTAELFAAPGDLLQRGSAGTAIESASLFQLRVTQGSELLRIDPAGVYLRQVFTSWPPPVSLTALTPSDALWAPGGRSVRYENYSTSAGALEVVDAVNVSDGWLQLGQPRAVAGCFRGCVVEGASPAAGASVWLRGLHDTTVYTAAHRDGCFVASVPAGTYLLGAATATGVAATATVSGATGSAATPSTCFDLGTVRLSPRPTGAACTSACPLAGSLCGSSCVDLRSDPASCGACGARCSGGQLCVNGACACTGIGRQSCVVGSASACVDTSTDASNCGRCGGACPSGQECLQGTCSAVVCDTLAALCGSVCVDENRDARHCGSCTTACRSDQTCSSGACACPSSTTDCGGACRNLSNDPANCGACGMRCRADQVCTAGRCACAAGQTECGGVCTNLSTDARHCGGCGTSCRADQVCAGGLCACPSGRTDCSGACFDLNSDQAHCGSCTNACLRLLTCRMGMCQL